MPLYDQYAPYRSDWSEYERTRRAELIEENRKQLRAREEQDDAPERGPEEPYLQGLRITVDQPIHSADIQLAYERAEFDLQDINMPTDPHLNHDFPSADPSGKHCRVDMGFAQRLAQIKSAAALCEGENKAVLDDFLNSYTAELSGVNALASNVNVTCQRIKLAEHAAKVCPNIIASGILENAANNMAQGDLDIQKLDKIFTAMEQVAGLRGGFLDRDTIDLYNDMAPGVELNINMATGRNVKRTAPATFDVNFQNFDNIARQNYYANPRNWGVIYDHKIPKEPTDSLALASSMRRYAGATAANALNTLFSATELQGLTADRASLVIVDGKTVNERMQEIYNGLSDKPGFTQWYKENRDRMSGEIVAGALMAGKRVEAYVPGPDGKLPDQPTVLHKTGYEPTRDKPVTLNAWERFFNRFGFYKGKAAQAKEHQELMAARERLKSNYTVVENARVQPGSTLLKDMFFGDYLRRNGIEDMAALSTTVASGSAYRLSRSAATSACICMMAAMGHDIRDILDPNKLQQEKLDTTQLYMQHAAMNQKLIRLTDPSSRLNPQQFDQLKNELMTAIGNDADKRIERIRSQKPTEQGDMTDKQWQQKNRELLQQEHQVNTALYRDCTNLEQLLDEARNTPNYRFDPADPRVPKCLRQGDSQWLGSVFFHGQRAIRNQIDTIMAQTDLTDPAQRRATLPIMGAAAVAMFDGFQECDHNIDAMHGYLRAAQQTALNNGQPALAGNILAEETMATSNRINSFFRTLRYADIARTELSGPHAGGNTATHTKNLIAERELMDMFSKSTARRFSDKLPSDAFVTSLNSELSKDDNIPAVAAQLDSRKADWQADNKLILSGEFVKSFAADVKTANATITESRKILQTDPNTGGTRVEVVRQQIPLTKVTEAPTTITPAMAERLGFNVAQSNQNAQQANQNAQQNKQAMGRR